MNDKPRQLTQLLALLLIACGAAAILAWSRLDALADRAVADQKDLALCVHDLAEMASAASPSDPLASVSAQDPELNRRLRAAATVAGIPDKLASIDPGPVRQLRDTDYDESFIFLRMTNVSLRQLVTFLYQLSATDRSVRTRMISLDHLDAAGDRPSSDELWSADITLAYLSWAAHGRPGS